MQRLRPTLSAVVSVVVVVVVVVVLAGAQAGCPLCGSPDPVGADEPRCRRVVTGDADVCAAGFTCLAFDLPAADPAGQDLCGDAVLPETHLDGAFCIDCTSTLDDVERRVCADPRAQDPLGLEPDELHQGDPGGACRVAHDELTACNAGFECRLTSPCGNPNGDPACDARTPVCVDCSSSSQPPNQAAACADPDAADPSGT